MKSIALVIALAVSSFICAQINIIPQPAEMQVGNGTLSFSQPVVFIYNDGIPGNHGVNFFKDYLKKYYNVTEFKEGSEHSYGLPNEISVDYMKGYSPTGSYKLEINKKGIYIGGDEIGIFYAFQTLI